MVENALLLIFGGAEEDDDAVLVEDGCRKLFGVVMLGSVVRDFFRYG